MKRSLIFSTILTLTLVIVAGYITQPTEVDAWTGWWGKDNMPSLRVVADTTSYSATWDNIVTVNGSGILYQVIFNSSSAAKDPNVRITVDSIIDSVKEASSEEVTRYVVLANGTQLQLAAAGTEDQFAAVDSVYAGGQRLDIPFKSYMAVDAHDEDGTAVTRVIVIYGTYDE